MRGVRSFQYDKARDNKSARRRRPERDPPSAVATVMVTEMSNVLDLTGAMSTGP